MPLSTGILTTPKHALTLTYPDGSVYLGFGPDEPSVDQQLLGVSFETEMPGGFSAASFTIPRSDRLDPLLVPLFAGVRLYDAETNVTLYEGRVTGTPQAGSQRVEIQCEGWIKALEDDNTARQIFYDRDLSGWQGGSAADQISLLTANISYFSSSVIWDIAGAAPGLETALTDDWTTASGAAAEGWYHANGLDIGLIDYAWKKNASVGIGGNWVWEVELSTDDNRASTQASANLTAAGPGSGTLTATAAGYKFARVVLYNSAAGGTPGGRASLLWTFLGVAGNHGLTLQGTLAAPNTGRGLYASDMLGYIVGRWAPGLTYTTGIGGSIETSSLVVPHAKWTDPTTARAMVEALAPLGGGTSVLDWGCWEGKQFFARTPGTYGRTWVVYRDQAVEGDDQGQDSGAALNGVMVTYDDGTGTQHSVGPVGSGADLESSLLTNTDPANPANYNPGERHWNLYAGPILSQAAALLVGQIILADAQTRPWRGTVTVKGVATEQGGAEWPAALIRAGDYLIVGDDIDQRPRRVTTTSYDGTQVRASVGTQPDRLATLLAKANVVLQGRL